MKTTVVQARQKGVTGYRAIHRGRGQSGQFGNPYRVGDPHPATGHPMTLPDVLAMFEVYLRKRLASEYSFRVAFVALRGQTLGCSCPGAAAGIEGIEGGERCHGHVMVRVLGEMEL